MQRSPAFLALAALVGTSACTGPTPGPPRGVDMTDYFEFAENLDCEWRFQSEDVSLDYELVARIENEEVVDDVRRYTMEYTKDCFNAGPDCVEGEFVRSMEWSVQGNLGINLHSVVTPDSTLSFDDSLRFSERFMDRGETFDWEANGTTYTFTMVEIGECPVLLEWTDCPRFEVTSASGPDTVTGRYWLQNNFNIVAVDWDSDPLGIWQLANHVNIGE